MVTRCRASGARVLPGGMKLPSNDGATYAGTFGAPYPRVAATTHVPLMPFLLEGVAQQPSLTQTDRIHPNAEGHRLAAQALLPWLHPLVPTPAR